MHAGKFVELVFHAKGEQQRLPGGAGQPPLGRPAWGCGHVATAFAWMPLMLSGGRCFWQFVQPTFSWASGSKKGRAAWLWWHLGPLLHRHTPQWLDMSYNLDICSGPFKYPCTQLQLRKQLENITSTHKKASLESTTQNISYNFDICSRI